jgi:hypothetical protein
MANVCFGISKSIFGMPHLNLGIAQFNFGWLIFKGGMAKIFFAKMIVNCGIGNASIVSGFELMKVKIHLGIKSK